MKYTKPKYKIHDIVGIIDDFLTGASIMFQVEITEAYFEQGIWKYGLETKVLGTKWNAVPERNIEDLFNLSPKKTK